MVITEEVIIDETLDNFYKSRIGIRFLINQHILTQKGSSMIELDCSPFEIIQDCIENVTNLFRLEDDDFPEIKFKGDKDYSFTYIPSHLHYIIFEILKNSVKANLGKTGFITIALHVGENDIIISIEDRGNSFPKSNLDKVYGYLYTTSDEIDFNKRRPVISGYGHGVGLSRIYARYFGGDLILVPFEGKKTQTTKSSLVIWFNIEFSVAMSAELARNSTARRFYQALLLGLFQSRRVPPAQQYRCFVKLRRFYAASR